jgi:CheY-like chemotaxis protein
LAAEPLSPWAVAMAWVISPRSTYSCSAEKIADVSCRKFQATPLASSRSFAVVHHGQEALQRLKEGPVDLVVVDIMMPNMSCLEFIEQIRGTSAYGHLPVLVISSEPVGDKVRRNRTPNSGAVGFAQNPLLADKVIAEVHRLLADA